MSGSGDYISRNAAIEAMYKDAEANPGHTFWVTQLEALRSLPAADVRPVVNGTWKKEFRINACCEWYDCTCSRCWMTFKNFNPSKYCPNCGADMREES